MNEFLKPFPGKTEGAPLHVSLAGITYPDFSYKISRPNSPVCVIEFILSGKGIIIKDEKKHLVRAGDIYLLPQNTDHFYYALPEDPYSKIFLNIEGSLCGRLISSFGLENKSFFNAPELEELFQRIVKLIKELPVSDKLQCSLQGIFVELLSRLCKISSLESHSKEALTLKNHLDSNLHRIVTNSELSSLIFRCPDYCQKLFKKEFSVTPYAYQLNLKMQTARRLLCDTKLSVEEISASLGYSDPHYFSNIFKKKCGCSPLSLRKRD